MRAVIQRVSSSSVKVDGEYISKIGKGILVLLGIEDADNSDDVKYMAEKIVNLRIFEDANEKLNLSVLDVKGELLVVSQFTLYGDCRKGRRPNFMMAAKPEQAEKLYLSFLEECKMHSINVGSGKFQASMEVELVNDGPVTLIIDSKKNF